MIGNKVGGLEKNARVKGSLGLRNGGREKEDRRSRLN